MKRIISGVLGSKLENFFLYSWAAIGLLLFLVILGPLSYALGGRDGLAWGLRNGFIWVLAFTIGASRRQRENLVPALIAIGLPGGLIAGVGAAVYQRALYFLPFGAARIVAEGAAGVFIGLFSLSFSTSAIFGVGLANLRRGFLALGSGFIALIGGLAAVPRFGWPFGLLVAGLGAVGGFLLAWLAIRFGEQIGSWARPMLRAFVELWPYLKVMSIVASAFTIGFLLLIVFYANAYGTIWRMNPASFKGFPDSASYIDFFYFSIVIATGLGADVMPVSVLARLLVSTEVILGLGWMIIVFAAVVAYISPAWEDLAARFRGRRKA